MINGSSGWKSTERRHKSWGRGQYVNLIICKLEHHRSTSPFATEHHCLTWRWEANCFDVIVLWQRCSNSHHADSFSSIGAINVYCFKLDYRRRAAHEQVPIAIGWSRWRARAISRGQSLMHWHCLPLLAKASCHSLALSMSLVVLADGGLPSTHNLNCLWWLWRQSN